MRYGCLHGLSAFQNERQLHATIAEKFAYLFHSFEQYVVDDLQSGVIIERFIQIVPQSFLLSINDPEPQSLLYRQIGCLDCSADLLIFTEERHESFQRITRFLPIVNQIQRCLPPLIADLILRQDFAGMDDRCGQSSLHRFVQESRVQHHRAIDAGQHSVGRDRHKTETAITHAQDRLAVGKTLHHSFHGVKRLQRKTAIFRVPGRDRKC